MSYDLAVWHPSNRVSNEEAQAIYIGLCEEDISPLIQHSSVDDFYTDLTNKHPEIDDVPDDLIDDTDLCPWSIAFDRSPCHLIMCCVWSRSDYVAETVFTLAQKHGLAVYDPQSESINYPDSVLSCNSESKPWWKFWR